MQTIAGMKGTGRRIAGPGVNLVELSNAEGVKHSALVVDPAHRDHPTLHGELEFGIGFMEQPDVTGLMRLAKHSPDEGAFIYPTGTIWSLSEVIRELAGQGEVGGVKAGLELCYMAGEILVEASDQSSHSGLPGHGSIDPWKLVLRPDGQVSIIGYGLPRPEIEAWLDDERRSPSEDALRYCAPENLKPDGEPDLGSDLFSLSLVALELMVGRPVYDGLASDIKQQALRGEAARKLYQWREKLPTAVREVLGRALKPDADTRYRDGLDYVYSVHDLLGGIDAGDGPSLRELITSVRARQKRGVAAVGGQTGSLTREELAVLAADIDAEGVATDLPQPRRPRPDAPEPTGEKPRWKRATRNRTGADKPVRGSRRRGHAQDRVEEATPSPVAAPASRAEADSARDRLLRRLRDRGQPPGRAEPEPHAAREKVTQPPPVEEPEPTRSSRRRRPGGRAAALLERLRSSSAETIADPPPKRRRRGEPAVETEPTVVATSPAARPPSRSAEAPAAAEPPVSQKRTPPASSPETPPPRARNVRSPARSVVESGSDVAAELPTEVLQASDSSEIIVSFEGRIVRLLREQRSAGELAELAARRLLLPAVDALGGRLAAFRLAANGKRLGVDVRGSALPPAVELHSLANRPQLVTVVAPDGTRSRVALGSAVPVDDLKPVLAGLFALGDGFSVLSEGRPLDGSEVIADHDVAELEIRT